MYRPILVSSVLAILVVGFNNCSNDTRFATKNKTKAQPSQLAGNGTPYGGNTGNGTPYGGIRKGSYFVFSNTVCPQPQRERIDVLQNPDNSLLVTKVYPCSGRVDVVTDAEVSISANGLDVSYLGAAYFHQSITGTSAPGIPDQDVLMNCFASNEYYRDVRTFQVIAYSVSDSNTPSGRRIVLEKITFDTDSGRPEVFRMNSTFNNGSLEGRFVAQQMGSPQTGGLTIIKATEFGSYESTAFSTLKNVQSGSLRCEKIDPRTYESWRNI